MKAMTMSLPMSPGMLILLSAAFLLGPWFLMPPRRSDAEIRGGLRFLWWLNAVCCDFWYGLEAGGVAPLPEHGGAILISNHTCSIDPMLLQAASHRVLGFLIAKEFFENWAFRPICRVLDCIPVRRDGQDLAATRAALRALKQGRVVPIFPEGRIVPTSGRALGEPKPGVAFLVLHAKVPVIPAYIWGTTPTNEIWKAIRTPARARVIFGPPIDVAAIAPAGPIDKAALETVSERLMGAIDALRVQVLQRKGVERGGIVPRANGSDVARRPDGRAGALSGDRPAVSTA
jgi:1-acyl-sn-glycerol-3-phosphate acyltransferase